MLIPSLIFVVRYIHVVAGIAWLGEVVTVSFVLLPAFARARFEERRAFLHLAFPLAFRLATVLGGAAMASGFVLILYYTRLRLSQLTASTWGLFLLVGGAMGAGLYLFHLIAEPRLEHKLLKLAASRAGESQMELPVALVVIPRAGLVVLLVVIALMIGAVHLP